jgi:hypothetical protein
VPSAIAAAKHSDAQATTKAAMMFLTNFVFITVFFLISLSCFGLPWLPTVGGHFWPFTDVLRKTGRFVTRKMRMTAEAAVSAALRQMQAARLPLQNYFGVREATIFSKHGSPRSRPHNGSSSNS